MAKTDMSNSLLNWYKMNGRRWLYWRVHCSPYNVLISELFLKKTTAAVVDRFLPTFLELYPDFDALNNAKLIDLKNFISPLGLSNQRSAQLKNMAQIIVEKYGGNIPSTKDQLLDLPGIGEYAAGAVLSFAYKIPEVIVDTNIARIISRLHGIKIPRGELRRNRNIWDKTSELIISDGQFTCKLNWALLDLGALVCLPKNPKHNFCPIREYCLFLRGSSDA